MSLPSEKPISKDPVQANYLSFARRIQVGSKSVVRTFLPQHRESKFSTET